jgi:hypothetical protein
LQAFIAVHKTLNTCGKGLSGEPLSSLFAALSGAVEKCPERRSLY